MDKRQLRTYRREAAVWAAEGKLAMSIRPAHLLELLDAHRPLPAPSAQEQRIEQLRREILDLRAKVLSESDRANRSKQEGFVAGVHAHAAELTHLRTRAARATALHQERTPAPV